jgi:hypothetical protein
VTVNILGSSCYNTELVYILIKQLTFNILLKNVKQGVFVLLHAVYMHPVIKLYHSYQYNVIIHKQLYVWHSSIRRPIDICRYVTILTTYNVLCIIALYL